jgi:hypothetical protein
VRRLCKGGVQYQRPIVTWLSRDGPAGRGATLRAEFSRALPFMWLVLSRQPSSVSVGVIGYEDGKTVEKLT